MRSVIKEVFPDGKHDRLNKFCPTCWIESQECTELFKDLADLSINIQGSATAGEAMNFLKAATNY